MTAMHPLFEIISRLEGFEAVAFWFTLFVAAFLMGYFVDWLMDNQGFGPLINSFFVLGGTFAGLYVRYNFFREFTVRAYEPYMSIGLILASVSLLLLVFSFIRNRAS